jgi:hypothetical protein
VNRSGQVQTNIHVLIYQASQIKEPPKDGSHGKILDHGYHGFSPS